MLAITSLRRTAPLPAGFAIVLALHLAGSSAHSMVINTTFDSSITGRNKRGPSGNGL